MTPDERAHLRALVDNVRRQIAGLEEERFASVCAYPPCGKTIEPKKHTARQRYCCANHRASDWHRQNLWSNRESARRRRQRLRETVSA